MNSTKKMVALALLTSIGIVLGILESGIPLPIRIPGAKLGLSNVIQLSAIVAIGYREAIVIAVLKSVMISIGTGNMSGIIYSLPSAVASTSTMIFVYHFMRSKFSLVGVSIFGALMHNLVQVGMAALLIGNLKVFTYYPVLSTISIFTGYAIGVTAIYFERYVKDVYSRNKI